MSIRRETPSRNRSAYPTTIAMLASLILVVGSGTAAAQLSCGDTVLPGQKIKLTQNVGPCTAETGGITVLGPATLDLNGFAITCLLHLDSQAVPVGVRVLGERAKIKNGRILACRSGIVVTGDRHRLIGVTAALNHYPGFSVTGDRVVMKNLEAIDNGGKGVVILGQRNTLKNTLAQDNGQSGILVEGTEGNVVVRNTMLDNGGFGLAVYGHFGRPYKIFRNVSSGNEEHDIYVDDDTCTQDLWRRNVFGTSSESCVD